MKPKNSLIIIFILFLYAFLGHAQSLASNKENFERMLQSGNILNADLLAQKSRRFGKKLMGKHIHIAVS